MTTYHFYRIDDDGRMFCEGCGDYLGLTAEAIWRKHLESKGVDKWEHAKVAK